MVQLFSCDFRKFFPGVTASGVFTIGRMQTAGFRNLILQAQAGDPEAIERLFREVSPFVEGLVRARGVRAGESVRDQAQDTCVRILSKLGQFRGADETDDEQAGKLFRGWVRVIAKNVVLNSGRDNAVPQPIVSFQSAKAGDSKAQGGIDPPGREPTGSANVRTDERVRLIQEVIDTLPDPTNREILRRRFFEEQTLEVIAKDLGLSYDIVRERCRKSMKQIESRLEGLV
jgi:RNA polymerase sigma factor (sigma-70 family)